MPKGYVGEEVTHSLPISQTKPMLSAFQHQMSTSIFGQPEHAVSSTALQREDEAWVRT